MLDAFNRLSHSEFYNLWATALKAPRRPAPFNLKPINRLSQIVAIVDEEVVALETAENRLGSLFEPRLPGGPHLVIRGRLLEWMYMYEDDLPF